jgi:glycosyltransferase involved in cell wall biosynthesis
MSARAVLLGAWSILWRLLAFFVFFGLLLAAWLIPLRGVITGAERRPGASALALEAGMALTLLVAGAVFARLDRRRLRDLGLDNQVQFVGFVSPLEVNVLYRTCRAVVFPTLFEGWGLPVSEGFAAGVPVACSRVTCLPEQSGGGALLFDPRDTADLARAVAEVWRDEALRTRLVARGREVVARLTWDRTAELFRAHYRRTAGRTLSARDLALLEAAPIC